MSDTNKAYELYRESFPSTEFLQQYLGQNTTIEGNPHRGEINIDLHPELRRLFDGVLRCLPKHILRNILRNDTSSSERVYVFKSGVPADWVDPMLENRGLLKELPPEAFLTICGEFIQHCRNGAFPETWWYQWQTDARDSIWVEARPGTTYRDRTLDELLDW